MKIFEIVPKFKVGDWVIQENIGVYKVIEICESWYEVIDAEDNHYSISFDKEYMCHHWTIQDAKEGDVLAAHECLVLFKEIDGLNIRCYCTYHYLNHQKFYIDTLQNKTAFCPATKEQCELLFVKMYEAGYEWDEEKKEVKKIKTLSNSWTEEDDKILIKIITALMDAKNVECADFNIMYNWLNSIQKRLEE